MCFRKINAFPLDIAWIFLVYQHVQDMIQELFAFILVSTLNNAFISYLPLIKGTDIPLPFIEPTMIFHQLGRGKAPKSRLGSLGSMLPTEKSTST